MWAGIRESHILQEVAPFQASHGNLGTLLALSSGEDSSDLELAMTGCTESGLAVLQRELDETIEKLRPAVESLMETLSSNEAVEFETKDDGFAFTTPLRFPDGIGTGTVVAKLFRYRERVRLDIEIAHNRVFARPDGTMSDRRCFMNDFVASTSFDIGTDSISSDFHRYVVSGIHAAREAVQRHNRLQTAPWNRVTVASR